MAERYAVKDPDEVLDYGWDWTDWLAGDTISTSIWTSPAGITVGNGGNGAPVPSNTTTTTKVWLLGGTAGLNYTLTNRITTAAGRTGDRSLVIQVRQR